MHYLHDALLRFVYNVRDAKRQLKESQKPIANEVNRTMGNGASVNGEEGFLSGMISGVMDAGAEAIEATANALESAYVVNAAPVRQICHAECQYFECMNAISRITYQDPRKTWKDDVCETFTEDQAKAASLKASLEEYCDGNVPGKELSAVAKTAFIPETKSSLKVYEVDTTRAITGIFELPHKKWSGTRKCFVVAFRGTKLQDEQGNFQMADAIHDLASTFLKEFTDSNGERLGMAGMGFITAYDKLRKDKEGNNTSFLDDLVAGTASCPGGLIVTGHSLGGALATLCAVDLLHSKNIQPKLITFGAPRALKPNIAKMMDERDDFENCRIINHGDPIPLLPPSIMGIYRHCGQAFFYKVPLPPPEPETGEEEHDHDHEHDENDHDHDHDHQDNDEHDDGGGDHDGDNDEEENDDDCGDHEGEEEGDEGDEEEEGEGEDGEEGPRRKRGGKGGKGKRRQKLGDAILAKVTGQKAVIDKSHGEWCEMDHADFHGEFPEVMKTLVEEIKNDAANMTSILVRVLLEIDIACHDLGGYGKHLVGYMERALLNNNDSATNA